MAKKWIFVALILLIAAGGIGYWREWFVLKKDGNTGVQVDSAKFKEDRVAFSKAIGDRAKDLKARMAGLWQKHETQTSAEKAQMQKELDELTKQHDRLEGQIKELNEAGPDMFDSTKRDLTNTLDEVEKKMDELGKKLEKGTVK